MAAAEARKDEVVAVGHDHRGARRRLVKPQAMAMAMARPRLWCGAATNGAGRGDEGGGAAWRAEEEGTGVAAPWGRRERRLGQAL